MAERIEFLTHLAGFLAIIGQSLSVRTCYNGTGNPVCYIADPLRDQRLKSWSAAMDYCRSLGNASLPTVTSLQDQFQLTEFLTDNNFLLDAVWLGGRCVSNGFNWTWIDGRLFSGSLSTSLLDLSFAAVTEKPDGNATFVALNHQEADGYICQFKGKTDCDRIGFDESYIEGDSCFALSGESINWLLARNKCLMRGADLATPTDTSEDGLKAILDNLQAGKSGKRYWIGLRKIWWKWVDANTEVRVTYFKDTASLEISTSADKNCLTVDYKQQFAWSIRSCSIPFQTICQEGGSPTDSLTTEATREATSSNVSLPAWAVGLISGLAGLIYIVSLVVVGVICCKCCRKPTRNKTADSETEISNRQKNSYAKEPKGNPGPRQAASNEDGFDGEYPDGEFDDYTTIETEIQPSGVYANNTEIANPKRNVRPK